LFFCFCLSSPLPDQSRGLTETITDRQEERDRYGAAIADHTGAAQSLQKFLQRSSRQGQVLRVDTASCQRAQVQGELGEGERAEDVGEDGGEAGLGRIWPHRACSEVSERASERADQYMFTSTSTTNLPHTIVFLAQRHTQQRLYA